MRRHTTDKLIETWLRQTLMSWGLLKIDFIHPVKNQIEDSIYRMQTLMQLQKKPTYEKPYFIDEFRVNLTAAFFHYNGSMNLTNFISGVLDMGATVTYHFNLHAEQGWNTTYSYVLPSTMTLHYANTPDTNRN